MDQTMLKSRFKHLEPDFYDIYRQFSDGFTSSSCERSWANLMLYMPVYDWHAAVISECLWVASFKEKYIFFPAGRAVDPETLFKVCKWFDDFCGGGSVCGDVPADYFQNFPVAADFFTLEVDPGEADYIYDLRHLASFSGSKLRKRHNQIRQFERCYENIFRVEKMQKSHIGQVLALAEKLSCDIWKSDSGQEEKLSLQRLELLWNDPCCGLNGVLLYVQDSLAGFSIYSPLSDQIADIHFEKADHTFTGAGAKLTAVLVEQLLAENFTFMNREQDLNVEGLRRAKRALDPDHLLERAVLTLI